MSLDDSRLHSTRTSGSFEKAVDVKPPFGDSSSGYSDLSDSYCTSATGVSSSHSIPSAGTPSASFKKHTDEGRSVEDLDEKKAGQEPSVLVSNDVGSSTPNRDDEEHTATNSSVIADQLATPLSADLFLQRISPIGPASTRLDVSTGRIHAQSSCHEDSAIASNGDTDCFDEADQLDSNNNNNNNNNTAYSSYVSAREFSVSLPRPPSVSNQSDMSNCGGRRSREEYLSSQCSSGVARNSSRLENFGSQKQCNSYTKCVEASKTDSQSITASTKGNAVWSDDQSITSESHNFCTKFQGAPVAPGIVDTAVVAIERAMEDVSMVSIESISNISGCDEAAAVAGKVLSTTPVKSCINGVKYALEAAGSQSFPFLTSLLGSPEAIGPTFRDGSLSSGDRNTPGLPIAAAGDQHLFRSDASAQCFEEACVLPSNHLKHLESEDGHKASGDPMRLSEPCSNEPLHKFGSFPTPPVVDSSKTALLNSSEHSDTHDNTCIGTPSSVVSGDRTICLVPSYDDPVLCSTFNKSASDAAVFTTKLNETFDKTPLAVSGSSRLDARTPDLELVVDQTAYAECFTTSPHGKNVIRRGSVCVLRDHNVDASLLMKASTQTTAPSVNAVMGEPFNDEKYEKEGLLQVQRKQQLTDTRQVDEEKENVFAENKRNTSTAPKRDSAVLESSFVQTPKRLNSQAVTPKLFHERNARKSKISSAGDNVINLHESFTFDLSAAVTEANQNNGVAEVGSFVVRTSSNFSKSCANEISPKSEILQEAGTQAIEVENYARVSLIALFDPIQPIKASNGRSSETTIRLNLSNACNQNAVDLSPKLSATKGNTSSAFSTGDAATNSLLINDLPTPGFLKKVRIVNRCSAMMQTDLETLEQQTSTSTLETLSYSELNVEEVTAKLAELNTLVEAQQAALRAYEQIISVMSSRVSSLKCNKDVATPARATAEIAELRKALDHERQRHFCQDETTRHLEGTIQSTFSRMAELRQSNAELADVVRQLRDGISEERKRFDDATFLWEEERARLADELAELKSRTEQEERSAQKTIALLRVQIEAKESELESAQSQALITKKEVNRLRALLQQVSV